jgi:hypothetical protein
MAVGYLACARCSSTGALVLTEPVSTFSDGDQPLSAPRTERCPNCSGAGKVSWLLTRWSISQCRLWSSHINQLCKFQVMCPTCLCTGMAMASEHDPRIDPFIWGMPKSRNSCTLWKLLVDNSIDKRITDTPNLNRLLACVAQHHAIFDPCTVYTNRIELKNAEVYVVRKNKLCFALYLVLEFVWFIQC